jgi:hypothetical protein
MDIRLELAYAQSLTMLEQILSFDYTMIYSIKPFLVAFFFVFDESKLFYSRTVRQVVLENKYGESRLEYCLNNQGRLKGFYFLI